MTEPQVYLIARPDVDWSAMIAYLRTVGGAEWADVMLRSGTVWHSDGETLAEFAGRLCYRSWKPGLNPNVRKIRTNGYLANIIAQKHGSVLEHLNYTFVFANVSRVLTHELVRHRAGCAISQESGRYVRLDQVDVWLPDWAEQDEDLKRHVHTKLLHDQELLRWMTEHFHLDDEGVPFSEKKAKTSFMRRFAPEGRSTHLVWTANVRALRHVIEARTAPGAEEEIRLAFGKVGQIMRDECPQLFGDFDDHFDGSWVPKWSKV